jgi:cytochrome c peroxidase
VEVPTALQENATPRLFLMLHSTSFIGGRPRLEDQVAKPAHLPDHLRTASRKKTIIEQLNRVPDYLPLFRAAFPNAPDPMSAENISRAISGYERTLLTPSPFDAYLEGNADAISPTARTGLEKFVNRGAWPAARAWELAAAST